MRISDWSSDVCSSDLGIPDSDYVALSFGCEPGAAVSVGVQDEASDAKEGELLSVHLASGGKRIEFSGKATLNHDSGGIELHASLPLGDRSEERRVGKECVSTCRSRWPQSH